jgi:hypothetical protein
MMGPVRAAGLLLSALLTAALQTEGSVMGLRDAVQPLAARYDAEDEDCRYFTLKAWDYIGSEEAAAAVAAKGGRDPDAAPRRLAARIRGS